jgi:hypothetical protein
MCTQVYVYLLIFPTGFLQRDVRDMKYANSVSPRLSHWVIGFFHNIIELHPSFSHWVFGGLYMIIGHQLFKGEC